METIETNNASTSITNSSDKKYFNFESWLLEEYKLVCDQYKHEDIQFLATGSFFTTLQSGLLAFATSSFASKDGLLPNVVPVIGFMLCIPWILAVLRLMHLRDFLEQRIKDIEVYINTRMSQQESFKVGNIRRNDGWDKFAKGKLFISHRWSHTMVSLPCLFAAVWILFAILKFS
jgi:hypothetical protein